VRFIARTYGVSAASISQASGLSNPDQLHVGQVLTVPAHPGWLYRVQPCETLDQISARTGVATDSIVSASGLSAASVGPGDVILIPDQSLAQSK
jgi:LysM repeat protein